MNRFATLFRSYPELPPAERQARIEQEFPGALAQSALHAWNPDDLLACAPYRLLIGVATYSGPDMRLLDRVEQAVIDQEAGQLAVAHAEARPSSAGASESRPCLHVVVFSTQACTTHEDFEKYIPGLGPVFQTPVAGWWDKGVLRATGSGASARALIAQACGLDPSSLNTQ